MFGLAQTRQIGSLAKQNTEQPKSQLLSYDDSSAGWPLTEGGECVSAKSDIEFWEPLRCRLIDENFKGISYLLILIQAFYKSKGVECSRIELIIITSCKIFVNSCVIDSSFAQTLLKEAHHICLQVQVDLFHNVHQTYIPIIKDFFELQKILQRHHTAGQLKFCLTLTIIITFCIKNIKARMVKWYNLRLPREGPGFDSRSAHLLQLSFLIWVVLSDIILMNPRNRDN
ncbi:hypothetical protein PHYBLDRAFT_167962 [Phycomyces blakesleeanus NRRL 1555(-)]|uniref:Uncharacterized protein n=1 Tax=Phycomyces blakesleeanus (strain ATCC 8743b / DSM 1359 / FGSC 10004 / NBRC 33097 / NRRL 1555) TaxID=763407 RepID=A0A162XFH6_PHYB8|nr:hypothetical protein PHYBLDRAFT_167962 [Phycomyces blakesleeanus NRRL 1555(-)]OAD74555.1 hypothetical protein PHYBLDRAFT_167962 [Phycomyces blakesleeanus NRRL 1555(-)]|eukprot:XP_018292595.1 hypothetical protein PHYBLDRAFT_167962 [Phycomyces blakesleeanus NRRL 1555(-)]